MSQKCDCKGGKEITLLWVIHRICEDPRVDVMLNSIMTMHNETKAESMKELFIK
jgi:hypothetical protein